MRSYSCIPKAGMRYQAPMSGFVNPNFQRFAPNATNSHTMASRPAANILREEKGFKIQLAVPGLTKEQIKIEFIDSDLVISAITSTEETKASFRRKEFDYTAFKRIFRLHKNADITAITATCEQGLLTISIPDRTPVTTQINIK